MGQSVLVELGARLSPALYPPPKSLVRECSGNTMIAQKYLNVRGTLTTHRKEIYPYLHTYGLRYRHSSDGVTKKKG